MTPQQIINEALLHFGQFSGRQSQVDDLLWQAIWEIETVMRPSECIVSSTYTATDQTTHLEITLPTECYEVASVLSLSSGRLLGRTSEAGFWQIPSWFPAGTVYVFEPDQNRVLVNRGGLVSPPLQYMVQEFRHQTRVAPNVDLEFLDRWYPLVKLGLLSKLAMTLKDMERAKVFEQEYLEALRLGGAR